MEKFSFFNDINNDRTYFAEDFARHLAVFFTNGIFNNGCKVLGKNSDMSVDISKGNANINGYRYDNDDNKRINIDNADGTLNRIDNIVIRLNLSNRDISGQVIKGSFAENPVAPPLIRTDTVYDLRIAEINIPAGTTEITQDLITDTRFLSNDCGNVVSTVQQLDTTDIFEQYDTVFNNWFSNLKIQLDGNVATNLQNQINNNKNDIKNNSEQINIINNEIQNLTPSIITTVGAQKNVTSSYSGFTNMHSTTLPPGTYLIIGKVTFNGSERKEWIRIQAGTFDEWRSCENSGMGFIEVVVPIKLDEETQILLSAAQFNTSGTTLKGTGTIIILKVG